MAECRREEKQLATERNKCCEGVPVITVVVDGGWSKKHSYNANSGCLLPWERRQESCYISVCATNIVPLVPKASLVISTTASSTGQLRLPKWRQISFGGVSGG